MGTNLLSSRSQEESNLIDGTELRWRVNIGQINVEWSTKNIRMKMSFWSCSHIYLPKSNKSCIIQIYLCEPYKYSFHFNFINKYAGIWRGFTCPAASRFSDFKVSAISIISCCLSSFRRFTGSLDIQHSHPR